MRSFAARLSGAALAIATTAGSVSALFAAEFRSAAEAAVLYDAPSRAASPLYVVSKNYPLEVVSVTDAWIRVRDHTGALSWIERRSLAEQRSVLVTVAAAEIRARADAAAPLVFRAAREVALELVEIAPGGWVRVRHPDGASGFVRSAQVWGL